MVRAHPLSSGGKSALNLHVATSEFADFISKQTISTNRFLMSSNVMSMILVNTKSYTKSAIQYSVVHAANRKRF